MIINNTVYLYVTPEKYANDAYDIVNLFYCGAVKRGAVGAVIQDDDGDVKRGAVGAIQQNGICPDGSDAVRIDAREDFCKIDYSYIEFSNRVDETVDINFSGGAAAYEIKIALYRLLKKRARPEGGGAYLPWGALVGIRPIKMYLKMLEDGVGDGAAASFMLNKYDVPAETSALCARIAKKQQMALARYTPGLDYALYIGIPFCATKCAYCSFPSDAHNKAEIYAGQYIEALRKELVFVAGRMNRAGRRLRCVYIGGGTPTALNARELAALFFAVREAYPDARPDEITVEAGRADTIDARKLAVIGELRRITPRLRICINPQTMNPETLQAIGRAHTPQDVVRSFRLARDSGFNDINMDIIAGLPGEDLSKFKRTLEEITKLRPEGFTAHTLCIKRSSRLNEFYGEYAYPGAGATGAMQDAAGETAQALGMSPYYLYKQKNTIGNLANIGYSLEGFECEYNMHEMADDVDVAAVGAGAVSKFTDAATGRIDRVFNVKNLLEYICRIDEMIRRKSDRLPAA